MRRFVPPAIVLAVAVGSWQAATAVFHVSPEVLPGPALVVTATWGQMGPLLPNVATTSEEALLGL
ncbi:MAG: ABC transporter permease, partial [Acidimicrobiales bacterium]